MPETRKSIRFGHSADPRSVAPHNGNCHFIAHAMLGAAAIANESARICRGHFTAQYRSQSCLCASSASLRTLRFSRTGAFLSDVGLTRKRRVRRDAEDAQRMYGRWLTRGKPERWRSGFTDIWVTSSAEICGFAAAVLPYRPRPLLPSLSSWTTILHITAGLDFPQIFRNPDANRASKCRAEQNWDGPKIRAKTPRDRARSFAPRKSEQSPGFRPEGNRDFLAVNSCAKVAEKRSVRLTYVRGI